jgi:hypothetical protein
MAIDRVGTGGSRNEAVRVAAESALARARQSGVRAEGFGASGAGGRGVSVPGVGLEVARAAARLAGVTELGVRAQEVESALTETQGLLEELRELIRAQRGRGSGVEAARARVGMITESIRRAEARASGEVVETLAAAGGLSGSKIQNGFVAANLAEGVEGVSGRSTLPPGSVRDVELEVLTSAVSADIALSFGGPQLDLASATSQFRILIEGGLGSQELSFASGTALSDIIAAINSFTSSTGVSAVDGPFNLIHLTAPSESDAFVSIRILDAGGADGSVLGAAEGGSKRFNDTVPTDEFRESSSAFEATIAGQPITIEGNTIFSQTDEWSLRIDVDDLERFNWRGTYDLFLLFGTSDGSLVPQEEPPPGFEEAVAEGVAAIAQASRTSGSAEAVDASISGITMRREVLRALIDGPLADARASAEASLAGAVRDGVKTGWRIDARG